jgi:hypothetical protein
MKDLQTEFAQLPHCLFCVQEDSSLNKTCIILRYLSTPKTLGPCSKWCWCCIVIMLLLLVIIKLKFQQNCQLYYTLHCDPHSCIIVAERELEITVTLYIYTMNFKRTGQEECNDLILSCQSVIFSNPVILKDLSVCLSLFLLLSPLWSMGHRKHFVSLQFLNPKTVGRTLDRGSAHCKVTTYRNAD